MENFDIAPWVGSPEIRDHLKEAWQPTVWDVEQLIVHARRPLTEKIKGLWALQRFAESREERTKLKRMHDYLRFCLRQIHQDVPGSLYRWDRWGRTDGPGGGRRHLGGGLAASYGALLDELDGLPASVWGLSATRYLTGETGPEALVSFDIEYFEGRFAETGFILVDGELARADFEGNDFEEFLLAEQRYDDLPLAGPYPYPLPFVTGDPVRLELPSRKTPISGVLYNGQDENGNVRLYLGCLREGRFAALDLMDVAAMDGWRVIDCLFRADPASIPEGDQILLELGDHLRGLDSGRAAEIFFHIFGDGDKRGGRRRYREIPLTVGELLGNAGGGA